MKKALFYWFSFLLILLFMTSCGTRKTQTSHIDKKAELEQTATEKKDLTAQDSTVVKVSSEVVSTDETTTIKTTYTPVDPTKPSSYTDENGTKKELNNASRTEEKTSSKSNKKETLQSEASTAKKVVDKGTKSNTTVAKVAESKKGKATDKTITYYWLLWFIPVGGLVYLIWRYKNCIWWV